MNGGWPLSSTTDRPNGRHSTTAVTNPARPVVRIRTGWPVRSGVAVTAGRPQRSPDRDHRHDRDEDAELRLDDRRDDGVDRRPLGPVPPQLAQAEEHEHHAERVGLPPDDAVEPRDRVEDRHRGRRQRQAVAAAELADHRPGQPADRQVGQDRRDLDQVADPAGGIADDPDQPQDVEVARRVVVEEVAVVEAVEALRGEVRRPEPEGVEVHLEARAGEQACDDEAEDETEREDHEDRADGSQGPGQPRRRSRASLSPAVCGASHRERLLHERGRWVGA